MTSRPRVIVQLPADPKQVKAMEEAAVNMRKESEKLSKIQDLKAIEAELVKATTELQRTRLECQGILRKAEEDAISVRHAADLEAKEIHQKAKAHRDQVTQESAKVYGELEALKERVEQEREELAKKTLEHGRDVQILEREYQSLHATKEDLKRREARLEESNRNLQTDLGQLTLRERKIRELEEKTIETLNAVKIREAAIEGLESHSHHIREDARRELAQANQRSIEAQEKWNRADRRELECTRREKELEIRERELLTQEQTLGQKFQAIDQREKKCLLREAQFQAGR